MALLSLLATAPAATLSREKLFSLLWPESEHSNSRHSLNVAVHAIRRALGDEVIRSVGNDLQLDLETLPCDVDEFWTALARGDNAAAVAVYSGPFMDGFYLDNAADFERWQEAERSRFAAAYAGALAALAEGAEAKGDWSGAVDGWRKLAVTQPAKARVTARLMRALELGGDRAGALSAADAHAVLMARDFDAQPDPEIAELATRMRARPEAAGITSGAMAREARFVEPPATVDVAPAPVRVGIAPPVVAPNRRRLWIGVAVGVMFLFGAIALAMRALTSSPPKVADPAGASLAVLPFLNLTGDSANQYLTDGLTEELLNALAKVRGLRVAARTSSFLFRDRGADVVDIGRRLNVSTVVEGSVRASGSRLRITAQLIDARSGYHMWSQEFDRPSSDILTLQTDIARAITAELRQHLAARIGDAVISSTTSSSEAHDLYLRGRFEWNKRTEEGMIAAKRDFERATEIDPRYAVAFAGLSDAWQLIPLYGHVPTAEALANAKTSALRALALDTSLAEAHTSLAATYLEYDHDRKAAEREYRRAIDCNPSYATAHHWYALFLIAGGRVVEATSEVEQARRADPLSRIINAAAGTVRMFARDRESAIAEFRAIVAKEPEWPTGLGLLGRAQAAAGRIDDAIQTMRRAVDRSNRQPSQVALLAYSLALRGRTTDARELLRELEQAPPGSFSPPVDLAAVYVALGQADQAFKILNRGVDERDEEMMYMKVDSRYDSVRSDPRFDQLLARLDLR